MDDLIRQGAKGHLTFSEDLWWWRDQIYVPLCFREYVLDQFHAHPTSRHWGVATTADLLGCTFSWPNHRRNVIQYVAACVPCQQVKVDHRPPQGFLRPLPIPDQPWSTLGMDFVVKLPLVDGFDSVMVVVDHLTKGAHFIPALSNSNVRKALAEPEEG